MTLGLTGDEDTVGYESERMKTVDYKNIGGVKGRREFVIQKKERRMRQGKEVKHGNSKYTYNILSLKIIRPNGGIEICENFHLIRSGRIVDKTGVLAMT